MNLNKNIVLIGFMGCGKTTFGKKLSRYFRCNFIDTDKYIENKDTNKMISYCLKCGIHGFANDNNTHIANEINNLNNGNKIKFVFKKLFIPIKQLFFLYPWSKLIITIPFAYIYRLFYLLVNKNKELKKNLKKSAQTAILNISQLKEQIKQLNSRNEILNQKNNELKQEINVVTQNNKNIQEKHQSALRLIGELWTRNQSLLQQQQQ